MSLVKAFKWTSYVILYEDNEGLVRVQDLLRFASQEKKVSVNIRKLPTGPGPINYRYYLHQNSSQCSGAVNLVIIIKVA